MVQGAYCTLLTKPSYLPGTLVLNHGLKAVRSKYPLVVLVTLSLPSETREILKRSQITTKEVDPLELTKERHEISSTEARFADVWTKLKAFELTEYKRIVLIDSDVIILQNIDELFELPLAEDQIAAAHACTCNPRKILHYPDDWIPENCYYSQPDYPSILASPPPDLSAVPRPYGLLNSGVVVLLPSTDIAKRIQAIFYTSSLIPTFKFPDQDLLSAFFGAGGVRPQDIEDTATRWKPIPYVYNALKTLRHIHAEFWKDEDVKVVHFILPDKPWMNRPPSDPAMPYDEVERRWWGKYDSMIATMREDGRFDDIAYIEGIIAAMV